MGLLKRRDSLALIVAVVTANRTLMRNNIFSSTRNWTVFALLFFLILVIYGNTFNASWKFDDHPNITENPKVHIKEITRASIFKTFFAHPGTKKTLYRPIPCLTFAVNWYLGKNNVIGYHIVNVTTHFLTAFILFLSILNLFGSPNLKDKYQGSGYFIALLTAALWSVNPIQTQAVTYIVQRMASMATMFYILSIYLYIKARINNSHLTRGFLCMGCLVSFAFALGCKENTATLPLALVLVEIVFFQRLDIPGTRRKLLWASVVTVFIFILIGTLLFMKGDPFSFLDGYEDRSFTLSERLMTEPRILIFYVTQIFYPVPNRLSIVHDVMISTSLFEPWTTIPAILIILLLIGIGLSQMTKRPIVAFAILFFFLNHIIESTILPLELIFEHRNYLPSLFLFFPVSVGLKWLLDFYDKKNRSMYLIIVSFVTLLLIGLGSATYIRNMAWATEKTLWEDAIRKAPGSARPAYNIARHYYYKIGSFDRALRLYEKALLLSASTPKYSRALCLNGMASIYYIKPDYEKVIKLCQKALDINPEFELAQHNMMLALAKSGRWGEASQNADILLSKRYDDYVYLYLKGLILINQKKPEAALPYLTKALELSPNSRSVMVGIGAALSLTGKYKRAEWFLRWASRISPMDIVPLFCLIENSLRRGDILGVDQYVERLLASFSIESIRTQLESPSTDSSMVPISRNLLAPMIADKLVEKSNEIGLLGNRK